MGSLVPRTWPQFRWVRRFGSNDLFFVALKSEEQESVGVRTRDCVESESGGLVSLSPACMASPTGKS